MGRGEVQNCTGRLSQGEKVGERQIRGELTVRGKGKKKKGENLQEGKTYMTGGAGGGW